MWFLFGEVSFSSGCLGWATLFYCGTPWAFHIIIFHLNNIEKTESVFGVVGVAKLIVQTSF